ncbi:hypothetical protein J2S43_002870 [Catenuloplanes nepalensis]|uniref:Uncharacterized protein n=1 Tax=Catenuloplanes nepalensis TaxID=587533 RepID=A0ABT9MSX7_9ACTN|nr:hypothetical protein [Catenuloplanes nepalensis]MDP9794358.1 hypothetical protein [Catenuloplanes nepalensis]
MTEPFGLLLAFSGADTGGIRFALSEGADALRWRVLRESAGVLRGASGPFLVREPGGTIRCLAAGDDGILVWTTGDLETWSGPATLPVGVAGVRAPKAYPDGDRHRVIFTAGGRAHSAHTTDFVTATAPAPLLDRAGEDVALLHANGAEHCFHTDGGTLVQGRRDGDTFTEVARGIGDGEAAVVFAGLGGRTWYLLADTGSGLRPYVTRVIGTGAWQPASPDGMPAGARRGGVVTVTEDEFKRLEAHA